MVLPELLLEQRKGQLGVLGITAVHDLVVGHRDSNTYESRRANKDVLLETNREQYVRPYCEENTASHPNSEVKLHQAQLVLGFERTWES